MAWWVYGLLCLGAPQLWAWAVVRAYAHADRRKPPRRSGNPPDYSI